ncbi:MAG: OsmC family peroxiredoxin [Spirochaetaceae bacterium]|nr:MAG: OsmC family peroxiredoxin [Spirochaetaceae bacterium]
MPVRKAEATWKGDLKGGEGWLKSASGNVQGKYSAASRFEDGTGTNPEELIAAAHAGCYSMALSAELSGAGHVPTSVDTTAKVTIEKQGGGFAITGIALSTKAIVPGISPGDFKSIAEAAKTGCPVSKALASVPITLTAELVSA